MSLPAIPTVPLPDTFSARVPVPHPDGLVGQNRSHHQGSGGELDQIRPFRFGDRLRRVHWPVSVRTGELHVTATHADQDTEILLLVDAMHDIGQSTGIEGSSSSLDNAVRAAGAIAEHYLRSGDRVGLLVLGSRDTPHVTAAAGSNHLRRLLDVLARATVADGTVSDEKRLRSQLRHHVSAGTLAIILTPAVSPEVLAHAVALARRGISVVTVDTLPADLASPGIPQESLAQLASTADEHPDRDPAGLAAAAARAAPGDDQGARGRRTDRSLGRPRHARPGAARPRPAVTGTEGGEPLMSRSQLVLRGLLTWPR